MKIIFDVWGQLRDDTKAITIAGLVVFALLLVIMFVI